jgi:nitrite transporter NirC
VEATVYAKTLDTMAEVAAAKAAYSRDEPLGFFVSSMMAGAYVGIGIILIFTLGQQIDPALRSLVMGVSFGIALTLVIFAGSDLFTGHTLFMTVGLARGSANFGALIRNWFGSWLGNLCGSVLLAVVFWLTGGGQVLKEGADLIYSASAAKMSAPPLALVARAALCNWLVCLAIWTSARATSDAAKCILIWWCLFAFIACGFEHSVANMTVFSVALLGNHPPSVSVGGMAYNLLWVTIGNIIGGAGFVGLGYLSATSKRADARLAPASTPVVAQAR